MITFRVELSCQGCKARFHSGHAHDNPAALPELAEYLIRDAILGGWTIDGAAHWCPRCVSQQCARFDLDAEAEHLAHMEYLDQQYWAAFLDRTPAEGGVQ